MLFWLNTQDRQRSRSKFSSNSSKEKKKALSQKNGIIIKPAAEFQSSFERESEKNDPDLKNNNNNISNLRNIETNSNPAIKVNKTENYQRTDIKQKEVQKCLKNTKTDQLRQLFNKYDQDQDGMLSIIQFENLMYKGKQQTNLQTSNLIFNRIKNLANGITFEDLVNILSRQDYSYDSQKSLRDAFANLDKKNKGYLELEDYLIACQQLQQKIDQDQLKQAFMNMDLDRNGKVTFEEFKSTISN